ncbi:hypothetical protein EJB05_53775, partial [Eragrostis curvula]
MSTAEAASGTRLSDLPDDLLQRILYFAPARKAASSTVLSRRWRSIWPTPWRGAGVHLDTRSYERTDGRREAFFRDAAAALAAHRSVKRLTIHVEESSYAIEMFMFRDPRFMSEKDHDIASDVLSHPACRGVEALHIEAYTSGRPFAGRKYDDMTSMPDLCVGFYTLSFGSVPSQALRELHITNCNDLESPPPSGFFPCLAVLQLQSCVVSLDSLQDMIVASPQLDTLNLDYVYIKTEVCHPTDYEEDGLYLLVRNDNRADSTRIQSFFCPTVTILRLVDCCYDEDYTIELDAPRVRRFRYSGNVDMFPLKSPPPDLRQVDLEISGEIICWYDGRWCMLFWKFLINFRDTKALKLKFVCPIEKIAVAEKKEHDELLGDKLFRNLEYLEVDGNFEPMSKDDAAVAIGNLLQCCPAVADLRLNLNIADFQRTLLNKEAQLDFLKSISHFMHHKDRVVPFGKNDENYEVPDIPGLTDKWFNFNCMQFYLKRVRLQFRLEKSNSFGVQLAKFFMEKAMVLEELYIDDGNHKMCEHMNRKFGGRITNPLQPCPGYKVFGGISQEAVPISY